MTDSPAGRQSGEAASSPELADDSGHPRRWAILAVLSAVAFMAQLDFFVVNVALAEIGRDFPNFGLADVSWVLNAYAIVFAAVLVPAGRIADLWGRKKVLLSGVALFTLASVVCAAAPDLRVLIAARAVQAVGAAMIVPASLGLLYPCFPKRQHTLVVGVWAGVAAVAASAGPPVGGVLVSMSWPWIFLINLPLGVVTIVAGLVLLPEVRQRAGGRFPDPVSAVSLLAAVALLVFATVQGPEWGWTSWRTIALFTASAAAAAVTVQRSLYAQAPVVEKSLFDSPPFTAATIALFLYFCAFSIYVLGSALYLQDIWHFSAMQTGLALAPGPLTAVGLALSAGAIQKRFGRTLPAVVGAALMVVAAVYWLTMVHEQPDYWSAMLPGLIIAGASGGLSQAPMFAAAGTLPPHRATTGSAVLNMSRQVGTAIGVAMLVALTTMTQSTPGYDHAWVFQAATAFLAAATLLTARPAADRRAKLSPSRRSEPAL